MKKFLLCFLLSGFAVAAPTYHQTVRADLNGDRKPELVALRPYNLGDVRMGQLLVFDSAGRQIWAAPRVKDPFEDSPWAFLGEFDLGDICWVDDFDKDGDVDMLATYQKSDVSPTRYKVFHWDGKRFVFDRKGALLPQPQKPATFSWGESEGGETGWIDSLRRTGPGRFKGTYMSPDGKTTVHQLRYVHGEGFVVAR